MKDIMEIAYEAIVNTKSKEEVQLYFAEKFREELTKISASEIASVISYKFDFINNKHIITLEFPIKDLK